MPIAATLRSAYCFFSPDCMGSQHNTLIVFPLGLQIDWHVNTEFLYRCGHYQKKKEHTCRDNYSVLRQDVLLQWHWEVISDGKITLLFPRMTTLTTHKWHICQSTSHKYSFFIANLFSKPLNCGVQGPTTIEFVKRFYFSIVKMFSAIQWLIFFSLSLVYKALKRDIEEHTLAFTMCVSVWVYIFFKSSIPFFIYFF